jgi:predicted tellurium resistance membrane protein TerC
MFFTIVTLSSAAHGAEELAALLPKGEAMMEWLSDPNIWMALVTLTALEIVLGIDNIIFVSIISSRLPVEEQPRARRVGLLLAMCTRILLLLSLSWLANLRHPLFHVVGHDVSGRDLILVSGGLFLIYKSTHEIHEKVEGDEAEALAQANRSATTFTRVIFTIALLDIVFSLDSVITAVGMVKQVPVMIAAIVLAVGAMMMAAESISAFVESHPSVKMLALSFLLMIGLSLVGEGTGHEIPKGYIYFSMFFSGLVEFLNIRSNRSKKKPVVLREPHMPQAYSWDDTAG